MRALPTTWCNKRLYCWCNKQYNLLLHPSYRTVQHCSARTAALAARATVLDADRLRRLLGVVHSAVCADDHRELPRAHVSPSASTSGCTPTDPWRAPSSFRSPRACVPLVVSPLVPKASARWVSPLTDGCRYSYGIQMVFNKAIVSLYSLVPLCPHAGPPASHVGRLG
jgi:hypothetical protein